MQHIFSLCNTSHDWMHVVAHAWRRIGVKFTVSTSILPPAPIPQTLALAYTRLQYRSLRTFQPSSLQQQPCSLFLSGQLRNYLSHHCLSSLLTALSKSNTRKIHTSMEPNGHVRQQKRKGSPVNNFDRPAKLLRQRDEAGESDDNQFMYNNESMIEAMVEPPVATADTAEWQATIEQVVRNVVSIHFCQTCSFDTSPALSSEATGFVVDAKKGYILTNRHVVGSGPFWGYCIFDNHEEVWCFSSGPRSASLMIICSVTSTQSTEILSTTSVSSASILVKSNTCPCQSSCCVQI